LKKILIAGGTSSLAKALKPALWEFNEVITAGRRNCDIRLDLNDPVDLMGLPAGLDVVIHTAAHFGGKTYKEISEAENINVLGTLNLCEAAVRAKAKHFILISSMFAGINANADNYNIYALSKNHAEEIATFYCSIYSLPLTILRPSQIYGNEEDFRRHQPFFYMMVDKAEKGEDITIYGSNDPRRNYIHIEDLTNIVLKVIEREVKGVYDCTNIIDVTYSQIAKAAFAAFNNGGNVYFLKDKPDIPDNIFERNYALYEKIGFYPMISIEEGIRKLSNYRRSLK
jgi:UDP-glucose 4-epimerase